MGTRSPRSVTLDSGALIAIEGGDARIRALLELAAKEGVPVYLPAPVIVEVWRGGVGRQAELARFLERGREAGHLVEVGLDVAGAKEIGLLLARTGSVRAGVADATVAWWALRTDSIILTSDPDDLGRLVDPGRIRVV